jgi:ribosomal protein S18 acetylase RimI-like enzyme
MPLLLNNNMINMEQITYREAAENDISDILELYKQLFPENDELPLPKAREIWKDIINKKIKYFIAINDKNKIIATAFLAIIPNLTIKGDFGVIGNVITDRKYRKRGIGSEIIKNILDYAKRNNCFFVTVESNRNRTEAQSFYKDLGFDGESKTAFNFRLDNAAHT